MVLLEAFLNITGSEGIEAVLKKTVLDKVHAILGPLTPEKFMTQVEYGAGGAMQVQIEKEVCDLGGKYYDLLADGVIVCTSEELTDHLGSTMSDNHGGKTPAKKLPADISYARPKIIWDSLPFM